MPTRDMLHAIRYHGPFQENFPNLKPGAMSYLARDGQERTLPDWPASVNGVRFGYMEKPGKEFVAVRATLGDEDVVLPVPVPLLRDRHTDGKGFAPPPTTFGSDSARHLLDDMIASNASCADALRRIKASIPD